MARIEEQPTRFQSPYHAGRILAGLSYSEEHPTTRVFVAFPKITQLFAEETGVKFPGELAEQLGLERQSWQQVLVHGATLDSQLFIAGETDRPLPISQAQAVIVANSELLQISGTHKGLRRIFAVGFNLGNIMEPYGGLVSATDEEFMKPPQAKDFPPPIQPAHGQWREIYHPKFYQAMIAYGGTARPLDHQQINYSEYGVITPTMAQQTGRGETPHTQLLKVILHSRYSSFAANTVLREGIGINFPRERGFSVEMAGANFAISYRPPQGETSSLQTWQIQVPQRLQRA